jgi:hypothetical protein
MVEQKDKKKVDIVGIPVAVPEIPPKVYPIKTVEIRMWCDNVSTCGKHGKPTIFASKDFVTWPYIPHVWRCAKCGSSGRIGCFEITVDMVEGKEKKTEWHLWGCS